MNTQHIILIIFIFILSYFTFRDTIKNNEFFTYIFPKPERKSPFYPISFQQNVVTNTGNQEINNDKYYYILQILKQTKQLGNSGYPEPLIFNIPSLPITKSIMKKEDISKLYPIFNYILTTMNKLGNGNDIFVFVDSKYATKEEIENQMRIRFEIICNYTKKINQTYYNGKDKEVTADMGSIILDVEIIVYRENIDNIFDKKYNDLDKIYINVLRLNGFGSNEMLPGNNVDDFTTCFYYNPSYTNILVDKKISQNKEEIEKK